MLIYFDRDDGKEEGEYGPIFYKNSKFKLLDSGYFWLSETPNIPGTFGLYLVIIFQACF